MKLSLPQLHELKLARTPIVMVTAYDHPSGRIVDEAGVDMVLVGDSAANIVLGHDPSRRCGATMDELLILTRAVARACEHALVIGDLPFMSYQVSDEDAVRNGGRFIKEAGADAVKLEGAGPSLQRAAALVAAGIPVMGHIGLTPQTATMLGGHKAQGRQWQHAEGAVRLGGRAARRRAASRSCSSACPSRSPRPSPAGWRSPRSGSAPAPPPTARCWCCTTCSTSAPTPTSSRGS